MYTLSDPAFDWARVVINKQEIEKIENLEIFVDLLIEKCQNENVCTVYADNLESINYELGCVIYAESPKYPPHFFLEKQLDEWEDYKNR